MLSWGPESGVLLTFLESFFRAKMGTYPCSLIQVALSRFVAEQK